MVGAGSDPVSVHVEGVVVLAAPEVRHGKASAELHSLNCGNGKGQAGNPVLHTVQHGVPQAGGQAHHRALNDPAHGVQLGLGFGNGRLHPLPLRRR